MACRVRPSTAFTAALVGVTLITAAACSSSGSNGSGGSSSASATQSPSLSAKLGSPIKIGYAMAETGPTASTSGPSLPAAQAWVAYVNAHGGVAGHRVELDVQDTQGNPTTAQSVVKKLVEQDNVVAVIVSDPIAEISIQPYLSSKNIAVLDGSGYSPFWFQKPNFFGTSILATTVIGSMVPAAKAVGAKNLVAAVCSDNAGCQAYSAVLAPQAKADAITYSGLVEVSASATDYTAPCLQFQQKKADFVDVTLEVSQAKSMMTQCLRQGYSGWFGTGATSFSPKDYSSVTGMKMAGTINGFPWWVNDAPVKTFRTAMQTYAPKANYASSAATTVWTSLELFRKALTGQTGAITRASVLTAMYSIKNETLDGLLPQPTTFTKGKASPTVNCYWQYTYKAGDANPKSVATAGGKSGNGQTGDLASTCSS